MKIIPLQRKDNALHLSAKINSSFSIDFLLDTGCTSTVLSKEIADMLFLSGKLKDDDEVGIEYSNWGSHYQARQKIINIKRLSIGNMTIRDVRATICGRYGCPTLFGMSALDKLNNYSIKEDGIYIDDGTELIATIGAGKKKEIKDIKRFSRNLLKKLYEEKEKNSGSDFKYDYTKWCYTIFDILSCCYKPLVEKDKFNKVISILEELRPLIQNNLDYDENNTDERGAFITAYFYFYLASAYYQADRRQESLDCYEKAKKFFLSGTPTLQEIEDCMVKIRQKLTDDGIEGEPELVPMRTVTLEEDVNKLGLQHVTFIDNIYSDGRKKMGYIGFKDFRAAFDFCIFHRKRMEVIQRIDGEWHRTGRLPIDDLSVYDIKLDDSFIIGNFPNDIEERAKKLLDELTDVSEQQIAKISINKERALNELNTDKGICSWKKQLVLDKNDLSIDSIIMSGANIKWHSQEFAICAMDVEPEIAQKLVDAVLAGKFIPCALGQMPEDFLFLEQQSGYFRVSTDKDYSANNNPNRSKWITGYFVVLDNECSVGYSYRVTYDGLHWRWEEGEHSNVGRLQKGGEDINNNSDHLFCYWQLVRKEGGVDNSVMDPQPF